MENILIILAMIAILMSAYCGVIAIKKTEEHDDNIAHIAMDVAKLKNKTEEHDEHIAEMEAAYGEAQELITATKEYTQEATNREILMQNGINSILGYDAMSALKDGGNKE